MGYKLKRILIYPDGVTEKQVYPKWEWKPGENTLLYLPLESDVVDQSGKTGRTFTTSGLSYTTVGGVPSVHIETTGGLKLTAPYPLQSDITKPMTISVLVYITSGQVNYRRCILDIAATYGNRLYLAFQENTSNILFSNVDTDISGAFTSYINNWMHIVITASAGTPFKMYINGNLVTTGGTNVNRPRGYRPYSHDNSQGILSDRSVSSYTEGLNGNARELIMEDKLWSADDVSKYYQRIKSKLGI